MKRILIVEDDQIIARMYSKVFSYNGFEVSIAHDGVEGWKKIKKVNPDLVILDVMMPKMNGLELLKKIKTNKKTAKIKILMLTNLGIQQDIDEALLNGVSSFITKSDTEPSEVLEIVKKTLF
jgi:DNA-binding response OmpR family regulator